MSQSRPMPKDWIALIGPEVEENLSLRYLAAALETGGIPCRIIAFNTWADITAVLEKILKADPEPLMVGLSLSFQWRAKDFLALAVALRERGYEGHITAGGHFGTFACTEILRDFPEIDSICLHEAEETIVRLADSLRCGTPADTISGLAHRDASGRMRPSGLPRPPDVSTLAWPDRRGTPASCLGHRIAPIISSRGCYAKCEFCCIAEWHEQTLPGKRYRLRPVTDVADEMAWLHHNRGIDVFIFHDDNFFLPTRTKSLDRIHALSTELGKRNVGRFATVVKARPDDIDEEVFTFMTARLGLTRLYLGVETDSKQGLMTLRRGVTSDQNHAALALLRRLGIYVCFNMLIFDPDSTVEDLETNLEFIDRHGECPLNFGRVELYAGTPLLRRMLASARCSGDYLGWDYHLGDPVMQAVFEIAMRCFYDRNFAHGSIANRLMGTRFDVEVCRYFHPGIYRDEWLEAAICASRTLARDSVAGLREIVRFALTDASREERHIFEAGLRQRLRRANTRLQDVAAQLEAVVQRAVGARCLHTCPAPEPIAMSL